MTDTIKTADASNMPALAPTPRAPKKASAADVPVTKIEMGVATTKAGKRQAAAGKKATAPIVKKATTKAASKTDATKDKAPKAKASGNTFTTVDLAAEHDINPKTLRARIRRNIDKWEPLFADGAKHVFKDNVTTRKAVAALLDA